MKDSRAYWIRDLEQLLDETVVKDVVSEVLEKFDEAIEALPPDSRKILSQYFDGTTLDQLSREHSVSKDQMEQWIQRIKRELAQQLRTKCLVKQ
jgi:RNA polymerase sigma factor (sigma-70 family)